MSKAVLRVIQDSHQVGKFSRQTIAEIVRRNAVKTVERRDSKSARVVEKREVDRVRTKE